MAITTYKDAVPYLAQVFEMLNEEFFHNSLPVATITVQSSPRRGGWFRADSHAWESDEGGTYEINIAAESLGDAAESLVANLLHQMVHLRNHLDDVQDTSRSGLYHNAEFKAAAEACGLNVSNTKMYGWSITEPGTAVNNFVEQHGLRPITLFRTQETLDRKFQQWRTLRCPCCAGTAKALPDMGLICSRCCEELQPVRGRRNSDDQSHAWAPRP